MSTEENVNTGHDYDGIEEYDNALPNWWLATLWIAIFFGIGYWGYYQTTGTGSSSSERYDAAASVYQEKMAKLAEERGAWTNERIEALTKDAAAVAEGKELFKTNCVACHGANGEGIVGPNLTDAEWIHGGSALEVFTSVKDGWIQKGMMAWGPVLGEEKVSKVTAFVLTMPEVPSK